MGQTSSRPRDMTKEIEVIGCGMSRTGTVSFGLALEKLLHGPNYHGGEALFKREESHIKKWNEILHYTPCQSDHDKQMIKAGLRHQMAVYVACTDSPPILFIEELMELYPNAKVICTIRDPDDWWRSMEPIVKNAKVSFLSFVFFPLPTLRYFAAYVTAAENGRYGELYFKNGHNTCVRETYDYHMEYLHRVVPKEKLHFFHVKEGWEPLCRILGKEVPDEPFPKANDSAAIEEFFKEMVLKGLLRWVQILAVAVGLVAVALYYMLR